MTGNHGGGHLWWGEEWGYNVQMADPLTVQMPTVASAPPPLGEGQSPPLASAGSNAGAVVMPAMPAAPAPVAKKGGEEIFFEIRDSDARRQSDERRYDLTNLRELYAFVNDWVVNQSGIKLEEKLRVFEMLSGIINAGVSVNEALDMLVDQITNEKLKRTLADIHILIDDGESLADAMARNPDIFDHPTCSIIRAGEKSGKLNEVLVELSRQYGRMDSIRKKVKSVMTYPVIVMVVMLLLGAVVMIFVVPKLIGLFEGADNLPLPTRIMIGMSDFLIGNPVLITLAGLGLGLGWVLFKRSKAGSRAIAQMMMRLPVVGSVYKGSILSRLTRMLSFLINAGLPIVESIKIVADIAGDPIYREKLLLASDDLTKGIMLAENLADDQRYFPRMLVDMVAIGEKTANLEQVMGKVADFYDDELERIIGTLSKALEPLIIMVIGVGVVFMILAIYLPILQINETVV